MPIKKAIYPPYINGETSDLRNFFKKKVGVADLASGFNTYGTTTPQQKYPSYGTRDGSALRNFFQGSLGVADLTSNFNTYRTTEHQQKYPSYGTRDGSALMNFFKKNVGVADLISGSSRYVNNNQPTSVNVSTPSQYDVVSPVVKTSPQQIFSPLIFSDENQQPSSQPIITGGVTTAAPVVTPTSLTVANKVSEAANAGVNSTSQSVTGINNNVPSLEKNDATIVKAPTLPIDPNTQSLNDKILAWFNKGIPETVIDSKGNEIPNPSLVGNMDLVNMGLDIGQTGLGLYGTFQELSNARRQLNINQDALNLRRDDFNERLARKHAIINQNRGV